MRAVTQFTSSSLIGIVAASLVVRVLVSHYSDLCQDLPSMSQRPKPGVASTTLVASSFISNKGDKE